MRIQEPSCGAALVITLGALLLPSLSQADVLACRGESGTITYTNGQCAENTRVRVVLHGARGVPIDELDQPRPAIRSTRWTRTVKVRNHRPDVASIAAAKRELQRMDDARKHRYASNTTQLAEYRE